ncbi:MAG: hypothetical protein MPL62_06950, partial [Alphaproteobacteria bacterium]|nr:hypothetical protein [Alphaproteobacteria bacterium]
MAKKKPIDLDTYMANGSLDCTWEAIEGMTGELQFLASEARAARVTGAPDTLGKACNRLTVLARDAADLAVALHHTLKQKEAEAQIAALQADQ